MSKYLEDLEIVDCILNKSEITSIDRIALLSIYQTSYHKTGKIEGITSCDSSCNGCTFCAKMREAAKMDPSIICGKCYDAKQEAYKTGVKDRHSLNLRIMSSVLFDVEELAFLPCTAIGRINSSGDIENVMHARNMIRFAKAHPYANIALWAKNHAAVSEAIEIEGKPKNLIYIASSIRINKPDKLPKFADYTFTVYNDENAIQEAIKRGSGECNGKKCRDCGFKCYNGIWAAGSDIAELLRK